MAFGRRQFDKIRAFQKSCLRLGALKEGPAVAPPGQCRILCLVERDLCALVVVCTDDQKGAPGGSKDERVPPFSPKRGPAMGGKRQNGVGRVFFPRQEFIVQRTCSPLFVGQAVLPLSQLDRCIKEKGFPLPVDPGAA